MSLLALLCLLQTTPETYTVSITLSGPNCEGCKQDIERRARRIDGLIEVVAEVNVAKKTGSAVLKINENSSLSRASIERALSQFTLTGATVTMRGEIVSTEGAALDLRAKASGQALAVTRSDAQAEGAAFDALRAAGKGKVQLVADLVALADGGQALRLKSYTETVYK